MKRQNSVSKFLNKIFFLYLLCSLYSKQGLGSDLVNFNILLDNSTTICVDESNPKATVRIIVNVVSVDPSITNKNFFVYLNNSYKKKAANGPIDLNDVYNGNVIKVVAADPNADPNNITTSYGEKQITVDIINVKKSYTLSVLTPTVCLDNSGNNGTVRLKISPYTVGATYDFHGNGNGDPSTPFVDKNDGTFERVVNSNLADNSNLSYFVIVTENGCASNKAYSGNVNFKRSQVLAEKGTPVTLYLSQTSTYELKNLFSNYAGDDKYNFKSLKGSNYVYKNASNVWVFDLERAKEGNYKDSMAYTPTAGGCAGGEAVIHTEIKVVNDKASLPAFLKTTRELPICKNESSFPLVALVKYDCAPIGLSVSDVSVSVTDDNGVHYIANENKSLAGLEPSINCILYNFNIEPNKYVTSNDVVIVTVSIPSQGAGCGFSGKITITKPQDVFITGLPTPEDKIVSLCSSSIDTLSMRGVPSGTGGAYIVEKGKFEGGVYKFKKIDSKDLRYTNYNSPIGDPSLEKFVAKDIFHRIISNNYDSLIKITYVSPKPCPDSQSVIIKFKKPVDISFMFPNDTICFGDQLNIRIIGSIGPEDGFSWNFGDGERVSSSGEKISYKYKNPGKYTIRFQTDIKGIDPTLNCNNDIVDTVFVGAKPTASYDVYNNYFNESIRLKTNSKILVPNTPEAKDTIFTWDWKFSGSLPDQNGKTVSFTCPPVEKDPYKVMHIATARWGCSDTATLNVPVFPIHKVAVTDIDKEEFNPASKNGWYHTGQYYNDKTKSSWQNIPPVGINKNIKPITPGNAAWVTFVPDSGGYRAGEKSWVESPVYEIGDLQLPMLSMDSRVDMNYPFDGAAVQFAFVDTTAFGKETWQTLGKMGGEGLNWYNFNLIGGAPGNGGEGWTNNLTKDWQLSAYRLDTILKLYAQDPANRKRVRFRIVLGTTTIGQKMDGFAFDNFFVGQRNRKIIVEEFCDHENKIDKPEDLFIDPQALRIQYHLADLVDDDEINSENPYDPSARGLLYGIGKTLPRVVLDGIFYDNDTEFGKVYIDWSQKSLLERSLITSPYTIELDKSADADKLNITATVKKSPSVTEAKNYVVQVAIVEKVATGNGQDFTNVLRKMLPNSAGHRISKNADWTTTSVVTDWKPEVKPESDIFIIAFLQDEDTKEIYQSEYKSVPLADYVNLYSGSRPGSAGKKESFNSVSLSPNPTSENLMVKFDGMLKDDYNWSVTDIFGNERNGGRLFYGTDAAVLSTEGLGTGIYYLRLEGEGRSFTKKFSVVK